MKKQDLGPRVVRSRILDFHGEPNWVNLCIENAGNYVRGVVSWSGGDRRIVERIGEPGAIAVFVDESAYDALREALVIIAQAYEGEDSERRRAADDAHEHIRDLLKQYGDASQGSLR